MESAKLFDINKDINKIGIHLLPRDRIKLFSDVTQRFSDTPAELKERLEALAARWLDYRHAEYGDSYGEYTRNKNRCNFENLYINRRMALMDMAFCEIVCGDGKYLPKINEMLSMILDENTWIVPAHVAGLPKDLPEGCHGIELYSSETSSAVSLVYAFLYDSIAPQIRDRIPEIIKKRTFEPYLASDSYNWMGTRGQTVNNWNPWINSNVIICAVSCAENDEVFKKLVLRACSLTENYIRSCPGNCLCNEGVRYWHLSGACLFDLAELLYDVTGGAYDITSSRQVYGACDYMTAMYDEYGQPANFADATIDFYPDCPLLIRAGRRTGNALLERMGHSLYRTDKVRTLCDNYYRQLKDILTVAEGVRKCSASYPEKMFLKGIDIFTARKDGFFLALKGGNNGENHNHNDLGSFVLYYRGIPVFIDPGVDLYSGFTFGKDRNRLWYMRSDYHSTPLIRGEKQRAGKQYAVEVTEGEGVSAEVLLDGAYYDLSAAPGNVCGSAPGNAPNDIQSTKIADADLPGYVRSMAIEGGEVTLKDSFDLTPNEVKLHFMLRDEPEINGNVLTYPFGLKVTFDGVGSILCEKIDITGDDPPDGYIADAPNRKSSRYSVLIPRLSVKQWNRACLYRLTVIPECREVTMKVSASAPKTPRASHDVHEKSVRSHPEV